MVVKIRDASGHPSRFTGGAVPSRTPRPAGSQLDNGVLAARYNAGASIRTLATEFGIAYGTVHGRLRTAGVTFRPRGGAWRATGTTAPLVVDAVGQRAQKRVRKVAREGAGARRGQASPTSGLSASRKAGKRLPLDSE